MASRAIFSNFFEEQWTQNHPQYISGLSRALFRQPFSKQLCSNFKHLLDGIYEYFTLRRG